MNSLKVRNISCVRLINTCLSNGMVPIAIQVNFFSLNEMCGAAFQRMATSKSGSGGSIVNLSSQAAIFGGNYLTAYSASKGAVNSLTNSLAKELGPEGGYV